MDVGRHPNIELLTYSELKELTGEAGNFTAHIFQKPRYVDPDLCTACGECSKVCPIVRHSEYNVGLGARKAIFQEFPQAVPSAYVLSDYDCLRRVPIACGKCSNACEIDCINHDDPGKIIERNIGAVIMATGIDYYDPREASEYGYTRFQNVVTSFELERLLSAGGPTKGELITITNRETPKSIAFINCVGSRNEKRDIHYCSRICCMNAIKSALLIREHYPEAKIYIFYIDIRAFGKGFEEFYQRSLDNNIKYIRGKPSKIIEDPQTGNPILFVENTSDGTVQKLAVDLAVLSSALIPPEGLKDLAGILEIKLDDDGFFKELDPCSNPLESTRPGVYLCGCSTAPKDITDSIAEASGAAAKATLCLKLAASAEIEPEDAEPEEPPPVAVVEEPQVIPQIDLSGEPRIGVFVCHCGLNIAGIIDIPSLIEYAKKLHNVIYVEDSLFTCSQSTQQNLQEMIIQHNINRVVVAACTPRTHEPVFRDTLKAAGLNPYLFEMANIRDQCSWVHQKSGAATIKAKDLIRMAVARVSKLEPLQPREMELNQDVLIIGGGVAGMQAAIDIGYQGFNTTLIEKEPALGGKVAQIATLYPSGMSGEALVKRMQKELTEAGVKVLTGTNVAGISGFVGNFVVDLTSGKNGDISQTELKVGAIVLAIGSSLYQPEKEFGYSIYSNILTNMEVERQLTATGKFTIDGKKPQSLAYFQCVGSRNPETNTGCSRYCCQAAIKQAINFREMGINVTIFYQDIRVYSMGAEQMYRKARELGVLFIQYSPDHPPQIIGKEKATSIVFRPPQLDEHVHLPVDAVILSVGMLPNKKEHKHLSDLLKVPRGLDGFFMERHPKFGPMETTIEGVFLTGCAQFPKDIGDSIAQSSGVAGKVSALLTRGTITLEPITSFVIREFCRACESCVEVCEFNAISIIDDNNTRYAEVNEALCKGCGTCAAICPSGAIDIHHFTDEQIETVLEALFAEQPEDKLASTVSTK